MERIAPPQDVGDEKEVFGLSREAWFIEAICFALVLSLLGYRALARRGKLVESKPGEGRRVLVRDRGGYRELAFEREDGADEMLQARVCLASPLVSGLPYTDGLHLGALAARRARRALFLGGGALLVPRQYVELYPDIEVRVAEIDPSVAAMAGAHFFVEPSPRLTLTVEDGRDALSASSPGSLDVIVVDAFGVGTTPRRLASAPFFALCRSRLSPGGCVVMNLCGALVGPKSSLNRRIYAGMTEVFGPSAVLAFSVPREHERGAADASAADAHNTILLAQRDAGVAATDALTERARELSPPLLPYLERILARRLDVELLGAAPLTDPAKGDIEALRVW